MCYVPSDGGALERVRAVEIVMAGPSRERGQGRRESESEREIESGRLRDL